jgi:pyruvate dehydrogenase E2 component (dihydrolipoamide acetyltransferase)
MPHPIAMPKPGQFTEECTILKWLKKEGDPVAKGDILFEIETDKSAMEVESFFEGTMLKILSGEGATVPVQTVVAFVGQPGEALPEVAPPAPKPKPAAVAPAPASAAPAPAAAPAVSAVPVVPAPMAAAPVAVAAPAVPAEKKISPRAKRLARESAVAYAGIAGTGPEGRIVERDVRAHLESHGYADLRISPAAKARAIQEAVDILSVSGSGEGGRILMEDVERAVREKPRVMSRMRQVIAQRLTQSFTTVPHFYVSVPADLTDLLAYRAELKARGLPYTVTDFISFAVVRALVDIPSVNSSTDGRSVWWHGHVNLGVAVSLEQGLVVPVVRKADTLSFRELREATAAVVGKARAGKLAPDEMSGGTFTISNMGMLNVEQFGAIINPGESAILAVASARELAVVREGRIVPRTMMTMTLSADHRIVDGADGARFINAIRATLEDVRSWRQRL